MSFPILLVLVLPSSTQVPAKLGRVSLTVDFSSSPPARPSGRTSSEKAGNQLNMLCNICRSSQVHLKTIFCKFKIWKMTYKKYNLNKRCISIAGNQLKLFYNIYMSTVVELKIYSFFKLEDELYGRLQQ